nr:NAD-dependent epimerase/dehydratase family protein [Rhodovibrio salinarum]
MVTGGCGFIGANLVADLLATGGQQIRVLDDGSAGASSLPDLGVELRSLEFHRADVRAPDAVRQAAHGVDAIVHLAGATGVMGSLADPRGDATANVLGTLNVLEAARNTDARVVLASTTGPLVGDTPRIDERILPVPRVPYGASKLAAEAYCQAYASAFGVATCVLRLTNVYGPGSGHKADAVGRFLTDGLAGRALTITGDGHQTRDFLYVGDVVQALRLAATHPGAVGQLFQIATARATSITALATAVQSLLRTHDHRIPALTYAPARPAEVRATVADPAKARDTLGWTADTDLSDGLERYYSHLTHQVTCPS